MNSIKCTNIHPICIQFDNVLSGEGRRDEARQGKVRKGEESRAEESIGEANTWVLIAVAAFGLATCI